MPSHQPFILQRRQRQLHIKTHLNQLHPIIINNNISIINSNRISIISNTKRITSPNNKPPHMITPLIGKAKGKGSGARNRAAKAARSSGYVAGLLGRQTGIFVRGSYSPGGLATFARHPGTQGSHVFERAAERQQDEMSAAIEAALGSVGE